MTVKMPISAAAAGTSGSPFLKVLSFASKAAGTYNLTDANFSGLGAFIPGWVFVVVTNLNSATTAFIEMSTDNGTTWKTFQTLNGTATAGTVTTAGIPVYVDSGTTNRIRLVTNVADVFMWPMGG